VKLVLFDIDGTLIRSHGVGRRALERAIEEVTGLSRPLDHLSLGGKTDRLILEEAFERGGLALQRLTPQVDAIFARYLELLAQGLRVARHYQVLPGVAPLLDALRATGRFALALGTGNIEPGARLKLERGALNPYFPTGGFGSDARERAAVLQAGVRKAEQSYATQFVDCWVVGDTPADARAAHAIGARALVVATGDYDVEALRRSGADAVLADLVDTAAALLLLDGQPP
jgi:phosphoglycolate phosphatase